MKKFTDEDIQSLFDRKAELNSSEDEDIRIYEMLYEGLSKPQATLLPANFAELVTEKVRKKADVATDLKGHAFTFLIVTVTLLALYGIALLFSREFTTVLLNGLVNLKWHLTFVIIVVQALFQFDRFLRAKRMLTD
jgi:hypothetical protein